MNIEDRISNAKLKIMLKKNTTFLSSLMLSLNSMVDGSVPTAATNGKWVKFNPKFVDTLTDGQVQFLVAHETYHVAFDHIAEMLKLGKKWNYATDYCINLMLVDDGFEFIEGGLLDEQYRGMSAKEIYNLLPDEPEDDNILDGDMSTEGYDQEEVKDLLVRAAVAAEMADDAGSIPADIKREIDKLLNPTVPWNIVLRKYMTQKVKRKTSWNRRSRRFKEVLPSKLSKAMGNVNCYVDASGSVSKEDFTKYFGEMKFIKQTMNPKEMWIMDFDTEIKSENLVTNDVLFDFTGGGGTYIEPVIEHIKTHPSDVAVIFTDGHFHIPTIDVSTPIIWVIVDNPSFNCDTGVIIHYDNVT